MATQSSSSSASQGSTLSAQTDDVQMLSKSSTPGGDTGFTDDANCEDKPDHNLADPHDTSPLADDSGQCASRRRRRKKTRQNGSVAQKTQANAGISGQATSLVNTNKGQLKGAHRRKASRRRVLWFLGMLVFAVSLVYMFASFLATTSIAFRSVLSPLCWVPGIARTPTCYTPPPSVARFADYPVLAEMQGTIFEKLLDDTAGGLGLSLEVKNAGLAASDLVMLVKASHFRSKDMLAQHLEEFVDVAKKTSHGLQRFSSHVGGAVDSIVAVNDFALHTIEAHMDARSGPTFLPPFGDALVVHGVVTRTFTDAMSVFATHLQRIILAAEFNVMNLDRLEHMLVTLHEMVSRENADISATKEELLAELWTILGGNRKQLRSMDGHLHLLRHIGEYRTRAMAHVVSALRTVTAMSEDMEALRERVSISEMVGDKIPVEVHLMAIRGGLERLQMSRIKMQQSEEAAYKRVPGIEGDNS